jgi:hypothetical protein
VLTQKKPYAGKKDKKGKKDKCLLSYNQNNNKKVVLVVHGCISCLKKGSSLMKKKLFEKRSCLMKKELYLGLVVTRAAA